MAVKLVAADDTAEETGRARVALSSTIKETVGPKTASASGKSLTAFFSEMICVEHCLIFQFAEQEKHTWATIYSEFARQKMQAFLSNILMILMIVIS
jgi:hypothetical protein